MTTWNVIRTDAGFKPQLIVTDHGVPGYPNPATINFKPEPTYFEARRMAKYYKRTSGLSFSI